MSLSIVLQTTLWYYWYYLFIENLWSLLIFLIDLCDYLVCVFCDIDTIFQSCTTHDSFRAVKYLFNLDVTYLKTSFFEYRKSTFNFTIVILMLAHYYIYVTWLLPVCVGTVTCSQVCVLMSSVWEFLWHDRQNRMFIHYGWRNYIHSTS